MKLFFLRLIIKRLSDFFQTDNRGIEMKRFHPKSDEVRATAIHLFHIKLTAKLEGYPKFFPIIDHLISINPDVEEDYTILKLDKKFTNINDEEDIEYRLSKDLEHYLGEQVVGDFIYDNLIDSTASSFTDKDIFKFIDFLSIYHRGIFQWMDGRGYYKDFEHLFGSDILI